MAELNAGWVVVSGAGGALGGAMARHFAGAGRNVLALDRDPARLPTGIDRIVARAADLTQPDAVAKTLAGDIPADAAIGLLVNAVGEIWNEPVLSLAGGSLVSHSAENLRRVLDANLVAPFLVAAAVAARMARGGGCIVNFSSIASSGNVGQAAYSAAKAGIEGMTRAMAQELGPMGIRVNAVAPGFVDVPTTRDNVPEKQLRQHALRAPAGRLGTIDDLIAAIAFLETASFVTGETLRVDGGLRL